MIDQRRLHPLLDSQLARWLAVAGWMALIFFLSSQSRLPSAEDPLLDLLFKKSAHFSGYALLAVLFWRALSVSQWRQRLAWLLTVVYASSDEWHQSFVPGRHPSPWDVLIDACGAVTGLLVAWLLLRQARATSAQTKV
jgi:VanZ family protein